jgi:hypothetical protein
MTEIADMTPDSAAVAAIGRDVVRGLEWVSLSTGFLAHTPFGAYQVRHALWSTSTDEKYEMLIGGAELPKSFHETSADGRRAAQADYASRILSALSLAFIKRIGALERENAGWEHIDTCPYRDEVDLWCVYGGEEFAQYDGGASIGKLVPKRFKTVEYGFFGNQSNDGVPQGHAPDLVPVAWRHSVSQCPPELIAEVLGIPLTCEDARTAIQEPTKVEDGERQGDEG